MVNMIEKPLISAGYKHTEVGVIPEDWKVLEIQEISKIGSGTTPARVQEDRYFKDGTSCWVKTLDLNNSAIRATEEKVTDLALKETCLQVYPKGTVLVAMYGGFNQIGRTGILEIPASVNQAVVAIQVHGNYNSRYLLDTLNYRVEYWKTVASSSRKDPNITSVDVKQFKLAVPSTKDEQTAIANALSDVDALIAALEKLINKKSAIKTAAMQQLLTGKKRLPPFDQLNTGYKQTELGEIPWDWEVKEIGDFISGLEGGVSVNSVDDMNTFSHGKSVLKTSCVSNGYFNPSEGKGIVPKDLHRARLNPKKGCIIISRMNTPDLVGEIGYVDKDYLNLFLPDRLWQTKYSSNEVNGRWLAFMLSYPDVSRKIKEAATGTSNSMKNISKGSFMNVKFCAPNFEEQTTIASVLSDMDKDLETLQQRLYKTQQIKQGMMQELLTGKMRLIKF